MEFAQPCQDPRRASFDVARTSFGQSDYAAFSAPVPASHLATSCGCASMNFLAASSSLIPSTAIERATEFWSSAVHWKFFTSVYAGLPDSANLVETILS